MTNSMQRIPFYFVLHGQTDWSKDDITKGPGDYSLNANGILQAEVAANFFIKKDEGYVVISSTLARAKETARTIADKLKIPVHHNSELNERYYGDFRLIKEDEPFPSDAELTANFQIRVTEIFTRIINAPEYKEKIKIIVSHGLVFK